ncbi:hypothetical protein HDU98_000322 [Podochytrium sp. JEL0797]|nr:hypothetical protein HDU98_000322 [Podochytrium sp. JEL0797]
MLSREDTGSSGSTYNSSEPTLEDLLEPFAVYGPAFDARFGSIARLLGRTAGHIPAALHTYAVMPLCMEAYSLAVITDKLDPTCPTQCAVGSGMKRLVAVVSSLVAQCAYCSSLGCGLGDVFNGAVLVAEPLRIQASDFSTHDRKVVRMVVAATKLPARVTPSMRYDVAAAMGGSRGIQQLAHVLGVVGFNNTLSELLACEIDEPFSKNAEVAFKHCAFEVNIHKYFGKMSTRPTGPFKAFADAIEIHLELKKAAKSAESFMEHIPAHHGDLDVWIHASFGFQPRYLTKIVSPIMKRTYCALVSKILFWTEQDDDRSSYSFDGVFKPDLPISDRLILCYVYMMAASNRLLAAHFAFLAVTRHGVKPWELNLAYQASQLFDHKNASNGATGQEPIDIMTALAYYSARRYHKRMWRLAPRLLVVTENPATVMSCITLLSFLTLLHRYSAIVDDCAGFEDEVSAFLETEATAKALGFNMDAVGASNSRAFDASFEEVEIEWDDVDLNSISVASASLRFGVGQIVGDMNDWGENEPVPVRVGVTV